MMKNILLSILLCATFVTSGRTMDPPPEQHEHAHTQRQHCLRPGMAVFVKNKDNTQHLTFLGADEHPVFECNVPLRASQQLLLARDGTLYVKGIDQAINSVILMKKDGEDFKSISTGLRSIDKMHVSSNGTLYVMANNNEWNKSLVVRMKKDKSPETLNTELKPRMDIGISSEGTLYVKGIDQQNNHVIIRMKEDDAPECLNTGLKFIDKMLVSSDDVVYVTGADQQGRWIVTIKGDKTPERLNTGLKVNHDIYVSSDNTLYVRGTDQHDNPIIVRMKEDHAPKPFNAKLIKYEPRISVSSDGTVYASGENYQHNWVTLRIKGDSFEQVNTDNLFILEGFSPSN